MRKILHVDMNSFFASCEQAVNPKLKENPLIVGGDPKRRQGIVLAASYDAKAFGVKTTMPIWKAMQLCKQATVVKPNHKLYSTMSKKVMSIFDEFTPLKEQLSIDEAFLDMTGTENLFGEIQDCAKKIQVKIKTELGLQCSVGISSNKLLAKMASDYKKPMGITEIYPYQVKEKLWPLEVSYLYNVGKKSVLELNKLGIRTIGELACADIKLLVSIFGKKTGIMMHNFANGIDERPVQLNDSLETKSVSNEITFNRDIQDKLYLQNKLLELVESVGERIRKQHFKCKTINLKLKFNNFNVITRSKTLTCFTDSNDLLYNEARKLLKTNLDDKTAIRLLGFGVSNLNNSNKFEQISLFELKEKSSKIDKVVDTLREKYGHDIIKRASTYKKIER